MTDLQLERLVAKYLKDGKGGCSGGGCGKETLELLREYFAGIADLGEALRIAAMGENSLGKSHSHQRRLTEEAVGDGLLLLRK